MRVTIYLRWMILIILLVCMYIFSENAIYTKLLITYLVGAVELLLFAVSRLLDKTEEKLEKQGGMAYGMRPLRGRKPE